MMYRNTKKQLPKRRSIFILGTALDGGIGRVIANLANSLLLLNYNVVVILSDNRGPSLRELSKGVVVHQLPSSHPVSGILPLLVYFFRYSPAAVITPNVRLTMLALRAACFYPLGIKVSTVVHSTYSEKFRDGLSKKKADKRIQKIQKYYPKCEKIISVSRGVRDDFVGLTGVSPERIQTIYNPLVTESLYDKSLKPIDDNWFNPKELPVIVGVGRLIESKNFGLLIQAFAILAKKFEARLIIIGEGAEKTKLLDLIESLSLNGKAKLVGYKDNPFNYIKNADVLAHSSNVEGFGNILGEALALGTAVVSTDCPHGPREILENGKYGHLVSVGDAEALADAILEALSNPPEPDKLIAAGKRFDAMTVTKQYLNALGLPSSK